MCGHALFQLLFITCLRTTRYISLLHQMHMERLRSLMQRRQIVATSNRGEDAPPATTLTIVYDIMRKQSADSGRTNQIV